MSLSDAQSIPPLPSLKPNINSNLNIETLPLMTLAELAIHEDEYEFGPQILVVLKGLVFDVTRSQELFGPAGLFKAYPTKDITYALAKGSTFEADTQVIGTSGLTVREKENLERWFVMFKNRFEIIGRTEQFNG
ncbi:hypothetical protein R3P38DRAFT_2996265 [Favolaschia claudopus]|uniref:Cytochrome b5 heme-binding domain-containing protein n=1 Tax=Favolaschia claudopus TaxID=2862362 RepID=A0AAW0ARW1_9AGAR